MPIPTTTISGTVYDTTGNAVVGGTVSARLSRAGSVTNGTTYDRVAGEVSDSLADSGLLILALVPNDQILPSGTYYIVTFRAKLSSGRQMQWAEEWLVPTSATPIALVDVERVDRQPVAGPRETVDVSVVQAAVSGATSQAVAEAAQLVADLAATGDPMNSNATASTVTALGSTTARTLAARFADVGRPEDFGAVGDGVTDDRAAISACITAHSTIEFGSKTYAVSSRTVPAYSAGTTYSVNMEVEDGGKIYISLAGSNTGNTPATSSSWWAPSSMFAINSKRVRGQRSWREGQGGTVITVIAGGSGLHGGVFGSRNDACELTDVNIKCNSLARAGVRLKTSNYALVDNVAVTGATEAGFYLDSAQVSVFRRLFASTNELGIRIQDCNASRFYDLKASGNVAEGIYIIGNVGGLTGGCSIVGADLEVNNTGGGKSQLRVVNTTTSCSISGLWLESADDDDGIVLDNARFVMLLGGRMSGAGNSGHTNRIVRLINASEGNTFVGCKVVSSDSDLAYEAFEVEANCRENSFIGCVRMTQSGSFSSYPAVVNYVDRNSVNRNHVGWGTAAPVSGYWVRGDIVWNSAPSAGGTPGWVCVTSSSPGPMAWKAMANLAA